MVTEAKHIVVIDDDTEIQNLIASFFKPRGYRITLYEDAEAAISKFQTGLKCDAVLVDLLLPRMSGIDFTKRMKAAALDVPIILITANNSSEVAVRAIQHGAYDFIVKPLHFPQLQVSVERAIQLNNLKEANQSLREIVKQQESRGNGIIGRSRALLNAVDVAKRVARSTANILITGESGSGKEVVAKLIHSESNRKKGPFVAINCSAIPENLLESELFGHAKGAFTGALEKRIGLFEEAEDGTLFLDEIGDLSLPLQAKILRVLQEKKIKRVGENQSRPVNARIVSATHKNLQKEIAEGRFREDLFFRLSVIPIHIPSLRERKEDIVPLAEHFLKRFASLHNAQARTLSKSALQWLYEQEWKGNVRELENAIERAAVMTDHEVLEPADFTHGAMAQPAFTVDGSGDFYVKYEGKLKTLEEVTQKYIEYSVAKNGGAKDKTARELGIDRKTLYRRVALMNPVAPAGVDGIVAIPAPHEVSGSAAAPH